MAEHSEHFMTEVLDKVAQKFCDEQARATGAPGWDDLDMYQRQQVKQNLLPTVLVVLDAASEVGGNADGSVAFAHGYEAAAEFYSSSHGPVDNHTPADRTEAFHRWKNEIR